MQHIDLPLIAREPRNSVNQIRILLTGHAVHLKPSNLSFLANPEDSEDKCLAEELRL